MTSPFKDGVEILDISKKDNGNGTSTVSLLYRETAKASPTPPRRHIPWWPSAKEPGESPAPSPADKPTNEDKSPAKSGTQAKGLPWPKILLAAVTGTFVYAVIMAIVRLN